MKKPPTKKPDRARMVRAVKDRGGYAEVARLLDTDRQYVHRWVNKQCPAIHVAALAEVLEIPKTAIRPDIFDGIQ